MDFPAKFVIASTLIFVNIFQNIAQERKVKAMIRDVDGGLKVNQEARE
jgi:hypothetical protein